MHERHIVILVENQSQKPTPFYPFFKKNNLNVVQSKTVQSVFSLLSQKIPAVIIFSNHVTPKEVSEFVNSLIDVGLHLITKIIVLSNRESYAHQIKDIPAGLVGFHSADSSPEDLFKITVHHLRNTRMVDADSIRLFNYDNRVETIFKALKISVSGTDPHLILYNITQDSEDLLPILRCNIIAVDQSLTYGYVAASNDDPNFEAFRLDLNKYPEVLQAGRTANTIVIDDIDSDALIQGVKHHFRNTHFNSLICVPLVFKSVLEGVIIFRAKQSHPSFSKEDIRLCQLLGLVALRPLHDWCEKNPFLLTSS